MTRNTKNPHAHIIFNSVNLDCDGRFQDFKRSAIAARHVSDRICPEHRLSIFGKTGVPTLGFIV
ncbi:relaxase/mobilization nuclease domain-containing protein [Faecalispora jeddahensis]|uniref:relaxase/mobilization nuclease domain-containing protein n=1 Tax=Faecalispora jeddahensis TaxID=1414721 RepID=UPI003FA58ECE